CPIKQHDLLRLWKGRYSMKWTLHFIALISLFFGFSTPASAQPSKPLPETKIVLRVSREFLQELTGNEYQSEQAIAKSIAGADVRGQSRVQCTFEVKLRPSETECAFDLVAHGTFATQMTATRRVVQANLHGIAPFDARRRIDFDGNAFTGHGIDMQARHQTRNDQVLLS